MSFEEIFNELILSGISFEDNSSILVTDNKWKNDFYNLVKFNILNNSKVDYVAFLKKPFKFKENLPLDAFRDAVDSICLETPQKMSICIKKSNNTIQQIFQDIKKATILKCENVKDDNFTTIYINIMLPMSNSTIKEKKTILKKDMFKLRVFLLASFVKFLMQNNRSRCKILVKNMNKEDEIVLNLFNIFAFNDVKNTKNNSSVKTGPFIEKYLNNHERNYENIFTSSFKDEKSSNFVDENSYEVLYNKDVIKIVHICHSRNNMPSIKLKDSMAKLYPSIQQDVISVSDVNYKENKKEFHDFDGDTSKRLEGLINTRLNQIKACIESRCFSNEKFSEEQLKSLAVSSLKFQLMCVTCSHDVSLNLEKSNLDSSSGVFVLYNYARVCTILRKHHDLVQSGYYKDLSPIEKVDFSSLKLKEEWVLLHNHLLEYSRVIHVSTQQLLTHKLCQYLNTLASMFSKYYSKTRILLENKPHLQSLIDCRLHLLFAIKQVFEHAFDLLSIPPFVQM